MKTNNKIIGLKRFAKSICHCERSVAILLALALVLSLGIIAVPMAGIVEANTGEWYVDGALGKDEETQGTGIGTDAFKTIQYAINDSGVVVGNTINVAAGTYYEHIKIDKALTVKSTGGAMGTIIDSNGFRYIVTIEHSDVTFEGFTVTDPTYAGGSDATGILIQTTDEDISNVQILDNIITQVRSETGSVSMFGSVGVNVGSAKWKGNTLSNIVVSGNTITDIKNPGDFSGSSASDHTCGINVWDGASNVVISYNTISDIKYNGIILEGASSVQISENDITGCESGVRIKPREWDISNIQISDNDITGCKYGISVVPEANTLSGLTINYNNLFSNTGYGVLNIMDSEIDATKNWWGHINGPTHLSNPDGEGDAVSDNVNFIPFLESSGGVVVNNVSITKSGPISANSGDDITYTITYKNIGTNYATDVVIVDTYPSEVEFVSANPAPNIGNNQWTIGTLAPSAGGTITVTVHIK